MEPADGEEKKLQPVSFVMHATRGLLRDQAARRKTMFTVIAMALLLMVAGSTILAPLIEPREHAVRFILFWLSCAWMTILALLLALLDLLTVRAEARAARKLFEQQLARGQSARPSEKHDGD